MRLACCRCNCQNHNVPPPHAGPHPPVCRPPPCLLGHCGHSRRVHQGTRTTGCCQFPRWGLRSHAVRACAEAARTKVVRKENVFRARCAIRCFATLRSHSDSEACEPQESQSRATPLSVQQKERQKVYCRFFKVSNYLFQKCRFCAVLRSF